MVGFAEYFNVCEEEVLISTANCTGSCTLHVLYFTDRQLIDDDSKQNEMQYPHKTLSMTSQNRKQRKTNKQTITARTDFSLVVAVR